MPQAKPWRPFATNSSRDAAPPPGGRDPDAPRDRRDVGGPDPNHPGQPASGTGTDLAVQIGLVARGDAAAFDAVFERAGPAVFGIVLRVIRDPAQSEEVTQEVLLEVWRNASKFDAGRGTAMGWVMMLAHRRAVDRVRSASGLRGGDHLALTAEPAGGASQPTAAMMLDVAL